MPGYIPAYSLPTPFRDNRVPSESLPPISSTERERAMPKVIPYNASLDEQNYSQPNLGANPLLERLKDPQIAAWVAAGGSPDDFYSPNSYAGAKPMNGEQIAPTQMMPLAMQQKLRGAEDPWAALGGSQADFYDPGSQAEIARQRTAQQLAKIRQVQQMFAPPSYSAIEQTMQNQAMGYSPQYQASFLADMANRAEQRQQSAASAMQTLGLLDNGAYRADSEAGTDAGLMAMQAQKSRSEMMNSIIQSLMASGDPELQSRAKNFLLQRLNEFGVAR